MKSINVRLRLRGNKSKYRKMTSTEEEIYAPLSDLVESKYEYSPGNSVQDGEWFKISKASKEPFAIDLMQKKSNSVDMDSFDKSDFEKIDYIFIKDGKTIYFQNVSKTKLVKKKRILSVGSEYKFQDNAEELIINTYPDAIYLSDKDELLFRRLESITGIFKGIDELYREATSEETEAFLNSDFIILKDGYQTENVKVQNRKRIAAAKIILDNLDKDDKQHIFEYIGEYCPTLKAEDGKFAIGNEEELKFLIYGIEQRFYTTEVGSEKRIAGSVFKME